MTTFLAGSGSETYTPTELLAGDIPVKTQNETLSSGENLAANTIVGRDSTTLSLEVWDLAATDGTQNPIGILVHAVDASGGAKACSIYVAGHFNFDALVVPGSITTAAQCNAYFDDSMIKISSLTHSVG